MGEKRDLRASNKAQAELIGKLELNLQQLEEDIDFLATWGEQPITELFTWSDEHRRHLEDIIKRYKERNND